MSTKRHTGPWGKVINGALLGPAVSFGVIMVVVGIAAVAQSGDMGFIADIAEVVLVVQSLALVVGFPVAMTIGIYKDASAVRRSNIRWSPSPLLYAIGNFFVALVGIHYVWKRYKYIPEPTHESVWWYLSVVLFVVTVGSIVGPFAAVFLFGLGASSTSTATAGGLFAGAVFSMFAAMFGMILGIIFLPIAVYMDARYLHAKAAKDGLEPINPVNYLIGLPFLFILPVLGGIIGFLYYANKRRRIAGLS
jgi:hypothetical protein